MKKKFIIKIIIDFMMTILLLFLMARQITGDFVHEWLGAGMMFLWTVHHILNWNWYGKLFKGKYSTFRILQVVIDIALFLSMIGLMVSGMLLSRKVFTFLHLSGGVALARSIHIPFAYWGFVLMAFHLGLHWKMLIGLVGKVVGPRSFTRIKVSLRISATCVAIYGVYAFVKNRFLSYMLLTSSFVFFDFEKPTILFLVEYVAIMGLFVYLAHYVSKGFQKLTGKCKEIIEIK